MLSGERLLIIEEVFLIALDIQRALETANARQTVFARDFTEAKALEGRFGEFDLAIVNPPRPGSPEMQIAERLKAAGVPIVVCTAARANLESTSLADAEVVTKPFADAELIEACRRALAKRRSLETVGGDLR
jgi:DNA-binding response OmpR family regulator